MSRLTYLYEKSYESLSAYGTKQSLQAFEEAAVLLELVVTLVKSDSFVMNRKFSKH